MRAHILRGNREEIAAQLAEVIGEVLEVIVLVDESAPQEIQSTPIDDDIFAEMRPYMVEAEDVDDSREGIYTRMPGE